MPEAYQSIENRGLRELREKLETFKNSNIGVQIFVLGVVEHLEGIIIKIREGSFDLRLDEEEDDDAFSKDVATITLDKVAYVVNS